MPRALFICSRNRLRSPTAEQLFAAWPGVESDSAGLAPDAEVPLSAEQPQWAKLIFVMERMHQRRLQQRFAPWLKGKRVICLGIADDYQYMQPELVELLERKAGGYLR
ncbi:phosphotyrosine protein phosphatase [Aquipseudomonas alcaligenes]|uniref:Phosphotyrosine protein phosphatase n=1 Tax=Aquipseudomonas alcaligenes TaxID=43263 RepID=A0A2V4L0C1_AQUAC|nr:low molecular weight protein tyrosine phosphatase family protein [Pseudomonas alcaligenes]PYC27535.1 phosphotyrosine protein phosphatase [Pseudomonas alcaligenes]